jgi:hypothetical protein
MTQHTYIEMVALFPNVSAYLYKDGVAFYLYLRLLIHLCVAFLLISVSLYKHCVAFLLISVSLYKHCVAFSPISQLAHPPLCSASPFLISCPKSSRSLHQAVLPFWWQIFRRLPTTRWQSSFLFA